MKRILGTIIAVTLLAVVYGGAYYYINRPEPVSYTTPPPKVVQQPATPVAPAATTPTPAPAPNTTTTPAPSYTPWQPTFSYTYTPPVWATPTYTPTYQKPYQATPPVVKWQTQPSNNCIGASSVGC